MHRKQVLWLHKSQNLRILPVSPVDYLYYSEYSFYFPPANWSCTYLSDIRTFKKIFDFFFSGPEAVANWVPPVSCQKLNPGSLAHDHVSFPLCLSTDTLTTEFWEFDSELHSLGLSVCVHIPNGYYVLICSELVSLFRDSCLIFLGLGICSFGFSWQRDLNLALCLLPLAFSLSPSQWYVLLSWDRSSSQLSGRTLWLFPSFALWFCRESELTVICTGHWYFREWDFWEILLLMFFFFPFPFPSTHLSTFTFHLASI